MIFILLILFVAGFMALSVWVSSWFWILALLITVLLVIAIVDYFQSKHSIRRNFPIVGHFRYVADWLHPKVYQYFVEPDTDGRPFSRIFRSIIYQRAKNVLDTAPFGTQLNVYEAGYEWMNHSIAPLSSQNIEDEARITIGGPDCQRPYSCSMLNVSAMSYGSLSQNAIMALNGGAAIGGFAHNTGEGGISEYHDKFNGDLIYQIGTGYFGCRSEEGGFSEELYKKRCLAEK